MRDAVIDGQLEHLGVDHDQAALLGREAVEQGQDHGVDGHRLARAGGAGDQQVGHAGEIGDDGLAADGLAQADRELLEGGLEICGLEHLAQIDGFAGVVRQLDADGIAARDHSYTSRDGAHGAGDILRERDDAGGFDARGGLELVERDHRPWMDMNDLAFHAEVADDLLDPSGSLLENILGETGPRSPWLPKQLDVRKLVRGEPRTLGRCSRGQHNELRPDGGLLHGARSPPPGPGSHFLIQVSLHSLDHLDRSGRIQSKMLLSSPAPAADLGGQIHS